MTNQKRQQLMDEYQAFLKTDFLSSEQRIGQKQWTQAEWDGHFNRLSEAFANFIFHPDTSPLSQDKTTFVYSYGEFLTAMLRERAIEYEWEDRSPEAMQAEHRYFFLPVCVFASARRQALEAN